MISPLTGDMEGAVGGVSPQANWGLRGLRHLQRRLGVIRQLKRRGLGEGWTLLEGLILAPPTPQTRGREIIKLG